MAGEKHYALTVVGGQLKMIPVDERIEGHVHERDFHSNTGGAENYVMLAGDQPTFGPNFAGDAATGTQQIILGGIAARRALISGTTATAGPLQVPEGTFIDDYLNQQFDTGGPTGGILHRRIFELLVAGTNMTITADYSVDPPTFTFDAVPAAGGVGNLDLLLNLDTPVLATEGALYKNVSPINTANLRKITVQSGDLLVDTDVTAPDTVHFKLESDQRIANHIDTGAGDVAGTNYNHQLLHAQNSDTGLNGLATAAADLITHLGGLTTAVLHDKGTFFSRDWVWETPVDSQRFLLFMTEVPITLTKVKAMVRGTGTPGVTFQIYHHAADVSNTDNSVFTLTQSCTEATFPNPAGYTGWDAGPPSLGENIPADSMIWVQCDSVNDDLGNVTSEFWFQLQWTQD